MKPSEARFLVVDSSASVRQVVCALAHQLGVKALDEAADAERALELMLSNHYDVVIAEWALSHASGRLQRGLRERSGGHAPVVLRLAHNLLSAPALAHALTEKLLPILAAQPKSTGRGTFYAPRVIERLPADIQVQVKGPGERVTTLLSRDWSSHGGVPAHPLAPPAGDARLPGHGARRAA